MGEIVGLLVGDAVGAAVGPVVGLAVGLAVGTDSIMRVFCKLLPISPASSPTLPDEAPIPSWLDWPQQRTSVLSTTTHVLVDDGYTALNTVKVPISTAVRAMLCSVVSALSIPT